MGKFIMPPCYKYIAGNLKSVESRYEFSKHFFEKMVSVKMERDDILILYSTLSMPDIVGNKYDYGNEQLTPDSYYDKILSLDNIPTLSCPQYYKSVLEPVSQNNLCQICEYSRSYKNENFKIECALFKFLVTSRENFVMFTNMDVPDVFKYTTDIAEELSVNYPALIKILSIGYSVMLEQFENVFAEDGIESRLNTLVGKITVESIKNPSVKKIQLINHRAVPVAWSSVVQSIISARDLTTDEVREELTRIYSTSNKRKKKNRGKKPFVESNPLLEHLGGFEALSVSSGNVADSATSTSEISVANNTDSEYVDVYGFGEYPDVDIPVGIHVDIPSDIPITAESSDEYSINVDYSDVDAFLNESGGAVVAGDELDNDELPFGDADVVNDEASDENAVDKVVSEESSGKSGDKESDNTSGYAKDGADNSNNMSETSDIGNSVESANISESDDEGAEEPKDSDNAEGPKEGYSTSPEKGLLYRVPPINEGDIIYHIIVNRNTLKHYALSYSLKEVESQVFSVLQKSKRLPVEVIHDERGVAYLFMFIKNLGEFVYCPIDSKLPNSLIAVMLSKSIIKICYQPYFLYSLLRMYGVRVSGVYSICTVDTLLHSEAVVSRYSEYFKIYEGNFENIPICDSGFPEFDELIMNMQKYILIHARQTRNTFDKSEYAKRHAQDEVLGSSFLRSINLKANEYLFKLEESGEIVFNTFYEQQAKTDGFFVTYSISADDIEPKYLTDIYLDALYELCNKGRFRKYNIQLITMTMGAMVLFIGESEYELITTALQKYFNRYALEYKLERFDLNVSHDRVYVNTQKGTKQRKIPSTYEQAMDLLVTTNDSVSVSESHIVKRAKVQRKKQERPYKPK